MLYYVVDTLPAEVGLTEAAGEIFEDALIVDVIIAINCKVVTWIVIPNLTNQKPSHGVIYEENRARNGWSFSTEVMGARLSKFSRVGQIRSFQGVVVQDDQTRDDSDNFSDESETFYSEIYNYDNIVTIETESDWVIFDYLLFLSPHCDKTG